MGGARSEEGREEGCGPVPVYLILAKNGLSADDSDFLISLAFWNAFQNLQSRRTTESEGESASRRVTAYRYSPFLKLPRENHRSAGLT